MSTQKLSNVTLADYRLYLTKAGCKCTRKIGGHEHWTKHNINRPITIQTHIEPVPEFIIRNGLRILGHTKKDFFKILFDS